MFSHSATQLKTNYNEETVAVLSCVTQKPSQVPEQTLQYSRKNRNVFGGKCKLLQGIFITICKKDAKRFRFDKRVTKTFFVHFYHRRSGTISVFRYCQ